MPTQLKTNKQMFNVDSSLKKYGLTHLFKFWVKKTKFRKKPGHEKPFLEPRDEPSLIKIL